MEPDTQAAAGKTTLVRARIPGGEYAEIRKEAIDREMHVSDYVALLLREGRKALKGEAA